MSCAIPECENSRFSCKVENKCLSFYRFPNDHKLKKQWRQILDMENVTHHTLICGEHFLPCDFYKKCGRIYLKKGAVPQISIAKFTTTFPIECVEVDLLPSEVAPEMQSRAMSPTTSKMTTTDIKSKYCKITKKLAMKTTSEESMDSNQDNPNHIRRKIKLSILRKELRKRTEENIKLKHTIRKSNEKIMLLEKKLEKLSKDDVMSFPKKESSV